ncbi:hypothetical protein J4E89_004820 [Alternaria sp. Ai002NY15]|nr:hypothetical protein J4E89_004820 [Alternaria sp. Ai002NY15]
MDSNETERERGGTASLHSLPDDTCFDMNALASSLRDRRDSVTSFRSETMAEAYAYHAAQPQPSEDEMLDDKNSEDVEMVDVNEHDNPIPYSPTPSSVYSDDDPLLHPFLSSLHNLLYTQSESGIIDDNNDNNSCAFLDEVLLDLDAWLYAGGLEMGGLHDDMGEEEYREYREWYRGVVGGVARGMVERGVMGGMGLERRRSV